MTQAKALPDSPLEEEVQRREFLRLMGASLALGGVGACTRQPIERIFPSARTPESRVPGRPLFFATAMPMSGGAQPILVENHMGRPTKIEGNGLHPAGFAATTAQAQASVLDLYDPDRSQVVRRAGRISNWPAVLGALRAALEELGEGGEGLRVLTETVYSPTLADQLWSLTGDLSAAVWHQYEPVNRDAARAGAQLAFGEDVIAVPRFEDADVVLAIDADFLASGPASVPLARAFAARRRARGREGNPDHDGSEFCRLYAVESAPSPTGSLADHRLPLSPARVDAFTRALARALGVEVDAPALESLPTPERAWVQTLSQDLLDHRGRAVVVAGPQQTPAVQALAHAMNAVLGDADTVDYYDPIEMEPIDQMASLRTLAQDIGTGKVKALIILGGNPAYTAPAELAFGDLIAEVPFSLHLSIHEDETSRCCQWHVPEAHFLETWSDTGTYDGGNVIVQPQIAPLYEGRSPHEVVAALAGFVGKSSHELVQGYWKRESFTDDFASFWKQCLHDGWVPQTAFDPRSVDLNSNLSAALAEEESAPGQEADQGQTQIAVLLRPDPLIWDGRFSNNAWLQELPKPITALTWDNAALVSPATAARLGIDSEQIVELQRDDQTLVIPVLVLPGHADDCMTVHLGYGRTQAGRVGNGVGANTYRLLPSSGAWAVRVALRVTGRKQSLARTQLHHNMEGRDIVRWLDLSDLNTAEGEHGDDHEAPHDSEHASLLAPSEPFDGPAWGMVIDLATCTGCNACTVACQAENNIPVVGKDEVLRGREMHWIRVDTYFAGEEGSPEILSQPVPCMHCENAPCEVVCPVGATAHSAEGLNDMVYNRCVGTRYCEANCPYKVRRFNFYLNADFETPSLKMQRNPDVTVRSRGVMEKCTYCVQRINQARIDAKREGRSIRDGEVVTACQGVCPSSAIVFGDLNDPESRIAKLRALPQHYGLLEELGVRPRTTYLARLTDRNEGLQES